jgi:hypothetical protein
MLTVLSIDHVNEKGQYFYKCRCDCGNYTVVARYNLATKYSTKSCGCLNSLKYRSNDIVGKKINMLTVLNLDHYDEKDNTYYYNCKCDCGNNIIVKRKLLLKGSIKSCGCKKEKRCGVPRISDLNDIVGKKFNKLTVLEHSYVENNGKHYYKCKCDCGNITIVPRNAIIKGNIKSCGCSRRLENKYDIIGKTFNFLTVKSFDHYDNENYYLCECICGNKTVVGRSNLFRGVTKSCGCKRIELGTIAKTKHGMARTKFYDVYNSMKKRCLNPNHHAYSLYGGRGIKICDRWLESFENFKEDMYESYLQHKVIYGDHNTSLDRIDVNGDYCPENCRWTTMKVQCNNKRNNNYITYNNERISIKQLIDKYADPRIPEYCIYYRINKGWDINRAITQIPAFHNNQIIQPIIIHPIEIHVICPVIFHDNDKNDSSK